jgi:hypothetical protein
VRDERVVRDVRLVIRRWTHEHGVRAKLGRTPRGRDRRARGLASHTHEQHPLARNAVPRRPNHLLALPIVQQPGLAVGAEREHAGEPGRHEFRDVRVDRARVHVAG